MSEDLLTKEIVMALSSAIRRRVLAEVVPKLYAEVDKIVSEELAGTAVSIGRHVSFTSMTDRLVIEVHMPGKKA